MLAAEKVSPEAINFMAKFGRGLVCLTLTDERLDHLRIAPMSAENTSNYGTAFCEAIDAREGVSTGISAYDRARTILVAIDPATRPSDLARPSRLQSLSIALNRCQSLLRKRCQRSSPEVQKLLAQPRLCATKYKYGIELGRRTSSDHPHLDGTVGPLSSRTGTYHDLHRNRRNRRRYSGLVF